jgi:hypothetical protein
MFTSACYYLAANNQAAGVVADGVAVNDTQFSIRNNHYIFTEDYDIVAATALGASLTAAQLDTPTIDAFNPLQVYPVNAAALTFAANPNIMDLRNSPIKMPQNEELKFQIAGGAGGAEADFGIVWLRAAGPGAQDYPIRPSTRENPRFNAIFTVSQTITIGTWSPFAAMTFTNQLRGGAYQVNGLWLVCAKAALYRINFVKMPMYQGRKIFPANPCDTTYGNQIMRFGGNWLGGLGRFNNFELPQLSTFGTVTTGAATYTGYADLTYLGSQGPDAMP